MKALVTGAGGFVGQWLCRALLRDGWEVAGSTLGVLPAPGVMTEAEISSVFWRGIDLRTGADERRSIRAMFERHRPDAIFHLAGVAYLPAAGQDRDFALGVNVGALVKVLDGLRPLREAGTIDPIVLVVGSGEQYGRHAENAQPLREATARLPLNFYAATKVAQEEVALATHRAEGIKVIATRSFNHSGRGQAPSFLLPALVARAVAARENGTDVTIGNTEVIRDFLHVEDVVTAYISLVARGVPGEVYNVCSGEGIRVGDLAKEVLAQAGVQAPLRVDPALQRAVDVPVLVGDSAKLKAATGWQPVRSRSDIIAELLDAAS
jgi:GDP-4-dehydro-6-deoxy-D-mannose reductase